MSIMIFSPRFITLRIIEIGVWRVFFARQTPISPLSPSPFLEERSQI